MAKSKRYADGGVTGGQNANIDDDTRARAMAWAARQAAGDSADESAPAARSPSMAAAQSSGRRAPTPPTSNSAIGTNSRAARVQGMASAGSPQDTASDDSSEGGRSRMKADQYARAAEAQRSWKPEDDALEGVYPEAMIVPGGALRAAMGRGMATAAAKQGAGDIATATGRNLAERGIDEATFIGRTAARDITPKTRIGTSQPRLSNEPRKLVNEPRKLVDEPRKIGTSDYAKGGMVKGWGQARGARAAKIV